jgi:hypothetical protein
MSNMSMRNTYGMMAIGGQHTAEICSVLRLSNCMKFTLESFSCLQI